ncbi:hypothetical protein [Oscillibacter sp. MSJ-31]|uniref:hypothetical protein n=1 Tax=Oscillibacter sp. MSJ-31 TaxID=2841526 RepID=UPI001C108825|nr:hypothetical protein [Oscillibacter sp. MSJ-31]MBU5456833.1 hypothetical protein [Oscillibacter sp. MSJ-31]
MMENVNCLRCRFRHEDNGNCTAVGGFCTAVPAAHCPLLRQYLDTGRTPEEINDLASVREISPEAEYAINKHADNIIERLDKLLHQTDDDTRLRELAEADKAGRLVVLPCKVGDTVYFRTYDCNGKVDLGLQPHKVTAIEGHAIARGRYTDVGLPSGQYGVSWFLTREEAEKVLEAMK